jgi:hypothetical protein
MSTDHLSFLPLTEPTFYILLSLAPGNKHGYAIMKDVRELSGARDQLKYEHVVHGNRSLAGSGVDRATFGRR